MLFLKPLTRDFQVENLPEKSVIFSGDLPYCYVQIMCLAILQTECLCKIAFNKSCTSHTRFIGSPDPSIYDFRVTIHKEINAKNTNHMNTLNKCHLDK